MGHFRHIRFCASLLILGLVTFAAQSQEMSRREISGSDIKQLKATIDLSFGHVSLKRGTSDKIVIVEYTKPKDPKHELELKYSVSDEIGTLLIRSEEDSKLWHSNSEDEDREWLIELTDEVPLSLRFKLGAGEGEIDLTGLKLQNLKISTGASAVRLLCDQPNTLRAETIDIESGVSKLTARDLCNTNFSKMSFSGGLGTYYLDFGGKLHHDAEVTIEVGLGAVTVSLPEHLPARIKHDDSWFSSFDLDENFLKKKKGVYESAAYAKSGARLVIAIESGLGSVKVRHR